MCLNKTHIVIIIIIYNSFARICENQSIYRDVIYLSKNKRRTYVARSMMFMLMLGYVMINWMLCILIFTK